MLFADNADRGNIAEADQQIRQRMWNLWPRNQSQENQCECLGCQPSPWNQNRRPHSRGSRQFTYLGSTVSMNMSKTQKSPEEPPAPCLNWPREPRETNTWLKEPKCTCRRHAFSVSCSMAVKLGPPTQDTNTAWTFSICDVSGASSPSRVKRTSPTVKRCHVLKPQACAPFSVSAAWDGLGILSHGWWTHPQRRPIRTINDRSQASRAPCSAVQVREKTWPQSMRNSSKQLRRCRVSSCLLATVKEWGNYKSWRKTSPERWREARSSQKQLHSARPPPASALPCAVGTATRALASTVTQDVAATPPIDKSAQALSLETSSGNNLMMMMWW